MKPLNIWKTACAVCILCAATSIGSMAQTFTTLAQFTNGSNTFSSLIQGADGNFYGSAANGGNTSCDAPYGCGAIFKVSPAGSLTTLYNFCSQANCADGEYPFGSLVLGPDGNFYGTTQNGGTTGLGTVFKITPSGAFSVLHSFQGADGSAPDSGLLLASDGNLYGTTFGGGSTAICVDGCGTLFKITPSGALSTIHTFCAESGCTDGYWPLANLIQGNDGNLYGTTYGGGFGNGSCAEFSCGTAFKIAVGGAFTTLHQFDFTDGANPTAPLVQAANGSFYGTTFEGGGVEREGCSIGCGTIFKIASGSIFSTVLKFHFSNGGNPYAGLIQATDGNLYGESPDGGSGEIFELTPPSTLKTVYSFSSLSGGGSAGLLQGTDGIFYGTYGNPGEVFSLSVGLGPFVTFVSPAGKVGQTVQVLGTGLTGATSVTFNGVPASSFKVISDSDLFVSVPVGAKTGTVKVVTPSGTLSSNVPFRVNP